MGPFIHVFFQQTNTVLTTGDPLGEEKGQIPPFREFTSYYGCGAWGVGYFHQSRTSQTSQELGNHQEGLLKPRFLGPIPSFCRSGVRPENFRPTKFQGVAHGAVGPSFDNHGPGIFRCWKRLFVPSLTPRPPSRPQAPGQGLNQRV